MHAKLPLHLPPTEIPLTHLTILPPTCHSAPTPSLCCACKKQHSQGPEKCPFLAKPWHKYSLRPNFGQFIHPTLAMNYALQSSCKQGKANCRWERNFQLRFFLFLNTKLNTFRTNPHSTSTHSTPH